MTAYNATATFLEKDDNSQEQNTVYWFEIQSDDYRIESGEYAVSVGPDGESVALDEDGSPIDYSDLNKAAVLAVCEIPDEMAVTNPWSGHTVSMPVPTIMKGIKEFATQEECEEVNLAVSAETDLEWLKEFEAIHGNEKLSSIAFS